MKKIPTLQAYKAVTDHISKSWCADTRYHQLGNSFFIVPYDNMLDMFY